jgi:hypothetical protein
VFFLLLNWLCICPLGEIGFFMHREDIDSFAVLRASLHSAS